jgi:YVTN family beta-propeller protein
MERLYGSNCWLSRRRLLTAGAMLCLAPALPRAALADPPPGAPMLLVLNKSDNTLAIVDPTTLKVLAHVPTGVGPHEVIASADGKTAYVSNYGDRETIGSSLSIIDLATRKERRLDLDLKRPHGLAEKNGFLYFTSEIKKCVARYNPASGKVDWTAQTDQNATHMVVASPDGKRLYTANIFSDTISIIDIATGKATTVKVGPKPEGLDISPDGKELWVGHNEDGGVSILDTATAKVTQTLAVCKVPIRLKFTPDGQRVLISDPERGELYIYDAKMRKEIHHLPVGLAAVGIVIAPDGKRAFVASMAENKVSVIDLAGLKVTGTITPGGMPDGLAWAEDRRHTGSAPAALPAAP